MTTEPIEFPLPMQMDVPTFGRLFLGLGRDASYQAAKARQITAFRVGRSLVCSTPVALRDIGWPDDLIARALGIAPEHSDAGLSTSPAPNDSTPDQELRHDQRDTPDRPTSTTTLHAVTGL